MAIVIALFPACTGPQEGVVCPRCPLLTEVLDARASCLDEGVEVQVETFGWVGDENTLFVWPRSMPGEVAEQHELCIEGFDEDTDELAVSLGIGPYLKNECCDPDPVPGVTVAECPDATFAAVVELNGGAVQCVAFGADPAAVVDQTLTDDALAPVTCEILP